jgi:hypothetical protein
MPVSTRQIGPCFAAEVEGVDMTRPLSPEEALKKVDQTVTVLMEIKSTGGNTARFLNSETDFRSEKNFAVFIPHLALASFQKAGAAMLVYPDGSQAGAKFDPAVIVEFYSR